MVKWTVINMVFMIGWLALNHSIDHALGIAVGSATDWILYMGVLIVVSTICSVAGSRART